MFLTHVFKVSAGIATVCAVMLRSHVFELRTRVVNAHLLCKESASIATVCTVMAEIMVWQWGSISQKSARKFLNSQPATGLRRLIGSLILIGHFPQK